MASDLGSGVQVSDGPALCVINKRIRALRKRYNRILKVEECLLQGKILNKEQKEAHDSKASVMGAIDELEKLKLPLRVAIEKEVEDYVGNKFSMVEDTIKLLYFAVMFSNPQRTFFWTPWGVPLDKESYLACSYINNPNNPDPICKMDLNLITVLGSLLCSKPQNSCLSHQNALQLCIDHAKLWLNNSDQPIIPFCHLSYAGLREKLNKIMASDYFTAMPEMRGAVEVAAAAGSYGSFQVPVHPSVMPGDIPVQVEGSAMQYEQREEMAAKDEENESYANQASPVEEFQQGVTHCQVEEVENFSELSIQNEPDMDQDEGGQNLKDSEPREEHHAPRRSYANYRGGRGMGAGGRRGGYPNGRGGRGGSRGGGYQNGGRNQYFDQSGNYYPRNNYYRGRGGRGFGGNPSFHGAHAGQDIVDS